MLIIEGQNNILLISFDNILYKLTRKYFAEKFIMHLSRLLLQKRTFSGIQPTGILHLGNYLGAVKRWVDQSKEKRERRDSLMFCVVDQHAITMPQDPALLRQNIRLMTASLIACGLDTENCILFQQSTVSQHSELCWILGTLCSMSRLEHLTQYKDKASKLKEIPLGLFIYPVLQSADILLYKASHIPVGEDNLQNLYVSQYLAQKFNSQFCPPNKPLFPKPEADLSDSTSARLRSLRNPDKKMSKSDADQMSCIYISDSPEVIQKKIKSSVTDSIKEVFYDPENRMGVANLISIYSEFSGQSLEEVSLNLQNNNMNKVQLKQAVSDILVEKLTPIQSELNRLLSDTKYIDDVIEDGRIEAEEIAADTMVQVRKLVGLR